MSHEQHRRSTEEAADRFLNLVVGSGFWQSIDLRVCAVRCGRHWVNLVTRGFLDYRPVQSVPRFLSVNRSAVRAWQAVLPVADLSRVVHGIISGAAKLGQSSVQYIAGSDSPEMEMRCVFSDLAASYRSAEYDAWSCHALVGHGSSIWQFVGQALPDPLDLDNVIRSGPNAYDGLSDLVRRFCTRPWAPGIQGDSTVVDLIAPLAVRFDREKVASSPERLSVALRAAAATFVENAELVWTLVAAADSPRHDSTGLDACEWAREDGGGLRARLDIQIRKGDGAATLFILVGGRCVDCVSVPLAGAGSNVRMRTHDVVDPGLCRFLEHLRPEKWHKATQFEEAVGLLFVFLGFHVDPLYAQSGLGDTIDSLAHDPASSVILAIECTVGPPDGKAKLSKLIARSAAMRSKLPDSEVIPVLATAILRAGLSKAEVEKAELDGVVLLARDDLDDLWTAAQAGETTAHVVRRLRHQLMQARLRRARGQTDDLIGAKPNAALP